MLDFSKEKYNSFIFKCMKTATMLAQLIGHGHEKAQRKSDLGC